MEPRRRLMLAGIAVQLVLMQPALAAEAIRVRVAVGKVTEVELPEKVAKVIKGGVPDSVLIEVLERSVYILPKSSTPADIFVSGISGESYPLNLVIAPSHDIRVQLNGSILRRDSNEARLEPMELMKQVLLGQEPAGSTTIKSKMDMVLGTSDIKLSLEVIYDFPHLAAYIFKASNLNEQQVAVPLQQISFPNLLAASCDQDLLNAQGEPGDTGNVYLVVGK